MKGFFKFLSILMIICMAVLGVMPCVCVAKAATYKDSISKTVTLEPEQSYTVTIKVKKATDVMITITPIDEECPGILLFDADGNYVATYEGDDGDYKYYDEINCTSSFQKGTNEIYLANTRMDLPTKVKITITSEKKYLKSISYALLED